MKIEDPTVKFSMVVPSRRRAHPAAIGERLRLGEHGRGWDAATSDLSVVIAASASALADERVERTLELLGIVGGLLADIGLTVRAVGAEDHGAMPSLVAWVSGNETTVDARARLAAGAVPGLSIGAPVEGLDGWRCIDPAQLDDHRVLVRAVVDEIDRLLGDDFPAEMRPAAPNRSRP